MGSTAEAKAGYLVSAGSVSNHCLSVKGMDAKEALLCSLIDFLCLSPYSYSLYPLCSPHPAPWHVSTEDSGRPQTALRKRVLRRLLRWWSTHTNRQARLLYLTGVSIDSGVVCLLVRWSGRVCWICISKLEEECQLHWGIVSCVIGQWRQHAIDSVLPSFR